MYFVARAIRNQQAVREPSRRYRPERNVELVGAVAEDTLAPRIQEATATNASVLARRAQTLLASHRASVPLSGADLQIFQ